MPRKPPEPLAYSRLGQVGARTPLVIAVPHAGRHYPAEMLETARLPKDALETIEDRHADLLVRDAVRIGAVAIVARWARAYVDLNRDEREIDPAILADMPPPGTLVGSAKVAGGLGVVPSRIAAGGAIWRQPLAGAAIEARLAGVHRPYHAAIAAALDEAMAVHGVAILVDCHSMPPIPGSGARPRVVIGDRHGRSASHAYIEAATRAVRAKGLTVARNHPYAGGYTLDRHGRPRAGRHALQVEVDRSLYLDGMQREPGPGASAACGLIGAIATALIDEAQGHSLAAE